MLQITSAVQKKALSALGKELLEFSSSSNSQGGVFSKEGKALYAQLKKALANFSALKAQQNWLRGLSCEGNDHIFYQQIFEILLSLEKSSLEQEQVSLLLQSLIHSLKKLPSTPKIQALQQKVQEHLGLYQGQGPLGAQVAFGLRRLVHDKRNLVTLAGMGLGMSAFGLTRLALVRNGTNILRANMGAFAAEGMLFTGGEVLAESALNLASYQSPGERLLHGYATMGILRGVGAAFGLLGRSSIVQSLTARSSTMRLGFRQVMPRVAEISGLSLSHAALEGQNVSDSLRAGVQGALHFAFLRGAMHGLAPGLAAINHRIQLQTQLTLHEQGTSWMRSQGNQLRNLFNQGSPFGRSFAPLGPNVMQMAKHDGLSAAKEHQELWGESRMAMDGASDALGELPAAPYSRVKIGIDVKRKALLSAVASALGYKQNNKTFRRKSSQILRPEARVEALYALHQISNSPHRFMFEALIGKESPWRNFLFELSEDAAIGLQKMAEFHIIRHEKFASHDSKTLLERFFDTEWFLQAPHQTVKRSKNRKIPPIGDLFLAKCASLSEVQGFSKISMSVTREYKAGRNPRTKEFYWDVYEHPTTWIKHVNEAIAIANTLDGRQFSVDLGQARSIMYWLNDKVRIATKEGIQPKSMQISLLRENGWGDMFEVSLAPLSSHTLAEREALGTFLRGVRMAREAVSQSSEIEGINFHIVSPHVTPEILDVIAREIPNLRVIQHTSLINPEFRLIADQRNGKSILEAA